MSGSTKLVELGNGLAGGGIDTATGLLSGDAGAFIMLGIAALAIGVVVKIFKS